MNVPSLLKKLIKSIFLRRFSGQLFCGKLQAKLTSPNDVSKCCGDFFNNIVFINAFNRMKTTATFGQSLIFNSSKH